MRTETPSAAPVEPALRRAATLVVDGVSKSYEGNQAVRDVSLRFRTGELVGLVGPNGAGKSTLIKILGGVVRPGSGSIRVDVDGGVTAQGRAATDVIGIVHQDLGLLDRLTVLENVRLGARPLRSIGPILSQRREHTAVVEALGRAGLPASLAERQVSSLTLGEKALVAVARTLATGARFLVMDEATSTLSPKESRWLLSVLRDRVAAGCGVLLVSHKLSEILDTADRCVVLVDGRVVADVASSTLDRGRLAQLMSPRPRALETGARRPDAGGGAPVLALKEARTPSAGPFAFTVHAGEVVGVTGLVGSGLYELAGLAAGAITASAGRVDVTAGVAVGYVPPDRAEQANFPQETVEHNLTASSVTHFRGPLRLLSRTRERAAAMTMHNRLSVHPRDLDVPQVSLSGGNQQKVILGRALLSGARALVLTEPTRGVDVATRAEIYDLIRELRDNGCAVLVVSSDGEDLLAVADRVGVVEAGVCRELWSTAGADPSQLASIL